MKEFNKYSSIGQFRQIVKNVQFAARYVGQDENDEPIYNADAELPVIKAEGTEKIHGTNACIGFSAEDGLWVQSKNNIITPEKDNAGCARFVEENKEAWYEVIREVLAGRDIQDNILYVYFEWCGGSIQAKTALTGLDKRAILFKHFKVVHPDETHTWHSTGTVDVPYANIYNINNYKKWSIDIDFNRPDIAQNAMIAMLPNLEASSPLGEAMGIASNIGEGIVWTFEYKGKLHKFKVKGEKHSNSKVTILKPVDEVKEQKKIDFANYATPSWRLEQAMDAVCGLAEDRVEASPKMIGDFLRLVHKDVIKEESDILEESGLIAKDVNAKISKIARMWFMENM